MGFRSPERGVPSAGRQFGSVALPFVLTAAQIAALYRFGLVGRGFSGVGGGPFPLLALIGLGAMCLLGFLVALTVKLRGDAGSGIATEVGYCFLCLIALVSVLGGGRSAALLSFGLAFASCLRWPGDSRLHFALSLARLSMAFPAVAFWSVSRL